MEIKIGKRRGLKNIQQTKQRSPVTDTHSINTNIFIYLSAHLSTYLIYLLSSRSLRSRSPLFTSAAHFRVPAQDVTPPPLARVSYAGSCLLLLPRGILFARFSGAARFRVLCLLACLPVCLSISLSVSVSLFFLCLYLYFFLFLSPSLSLSQSLSPFLPLFLLSFSPRLSLSFGSTQRGAAKGIPCPSPDVTLRPPLTKTAIRKWRHPP